ncbi:MAG TPA: hypothetical protein VMS17_23975, partial [Gemmataceae bacterium]|nr:hypothetical protein [Gemmataceae bacterium]
IVTAPSEFRSLLVILRLRTKKRTVYKGVILPGPSDTGGAIYARMKENRATSDDFTGTFRRLCTNEIRLDDPACLLALFFAWEECCKT